uniref:Putative trypsin-like serine protease n=1 Tax=Culex tarsalis TaxID=7177 RepID=A0A1Q3FM31_CULTA
MAYVSFIVQFFAIVFLIRSSTGTTCGSPKTFQQSPNWLVSIVYSDQRDQLNPLQCSGTIMNDRFVITATHCLFDLNGDPVPLPMLQIQSVNNVAINRSIAKVYHPKKFNVERLDDDIVLLKLDRPLTFNSYVSPICFDSTILGSRPEAIVLAGHHLEPRSELDVVDLSILPNENCNTINRLIFNTSYENSLCVGEFEASQTYHRKAGMALMIKANDTLFIGGIVLYTTGSPQGNISFAGGINLEPYATWIDKVINRHLRASVSEQKCQEYNVKAAAHKENTMWIPSVLLLDERSDFFKPVCFASLISEHFVLTAAQCKHATRKVYIQYDILDTEQFTEFDFNTMPSEPHGIALVKLPRKPRRFNQLINCLWTAEDTPLQFVAQALHALGHSMVDYFRAKYIPTKPIQLLDLKRCSQISSMMIRSAPGDVVAVNRDYETLRRIVGLSTKGFGRCTDRSVESIVEKLEWIEDIVWG